MVLCKRVNGVKATPSHHHLFLHFSCMFTSRYKFSTHNGSNKTDLGFVFKTVVAQIAQKKYFYITT